MIRARQIRYFFEALLILPLYTLLWLLPLDVASGIGGWLGRHIGVHRRESQIARRNLMLAFPSMTVEERERILCAMWENLGRVAGEFPHVPGRKIAARVTVEGGEYLQQIREGDKPAIFISGHVGNWELAPKMAVVNQLPLILVYRHANNPWVNWLIRLTRSAYYMDMFSKSATSAVRIMKTIKRGNHIGMLLDQKMNSGIPVPFFGHDAMTGTAAAEMALKFDLMLVPARVIRTTGAHFILKVLKPYIPAKTGDMEKDVRQAMLDINAMLESWIREHPEQWFWVHNRWPK